MDYNNTTSSFDSFELQFTTEAQGFLKETAKWAKFLAIIGFIFVALYVILGISMFGMGGAMSSAAAEMEGMEGMGNTASMMRAGGIFMGIICIIVALLYFFPMLYLYRFATKAQFALNNNSTDQLTSSIENLKSHYKFMGILMLIGLIFMALYVFLLIIGLATAASM